MLRSFKSLWLPVLCIFALPACSNTGGLTGSSVTTSSINNQQAANKPAIDPACVTLVSKIDSLRKDGITDRVEKVGAGKSKTVSVYRASLARMAELDRANAEYQLRCGKLKPATARLAPPTPVAKPATKTAAKKAPAAKKAAVAKSAPTPPAKPVAKKAPSATTAVKTVATAKATETATKTTEAATDAAKTATQNATNAAATKATETVQKATAPVQKAAAEATVTPVTPN